MTKIDGIEDVARIFAGGEEWLMECLSCGKNSEHLLCSECRTDAKFADIYQMVMHYSQENCQNEHVKNFVESFENPAMARDVVPDMINLLDADLSDYYFCRYYRQMRDQRFEDGAICYIESHDLTEKKTQQILYDLLDFYMRNDFVKPEKWCTIIYDTPDLYCELYYCAAQFFAFTAEYDLADQIIDYALSLCADDGYDKFLMYTKEAEVQNLNKLKLDIVRYRTKRPYWPNTEERREKVAEIYEKKGIPIPGQMKVVSGNKKVKESDFEPIQEFLGDAPDRYCSFWCAEAFGVVAAKGIYQIAAVKVEHGEIVDSYQNYIRPWDGIASVKASAKEAGVDVEILDKADSVVCVMKEFFAFVGDDILVSTGALGNQAKLISRAARYAQMKRIGNQFFDLLDYAADVSVEFDMQNNTRSYLLEHFGLEEGKDALEKANLNIVIMNKLKEIELI